jgi:hypothetical protein
MIFEAIDFVADLVALAAGHGVEGDGGSEEEQSPCGTQPAVENK